MENVVTLLDGKTINVDLTNIFYSKMNNAYEYAIDPNAPSHRYSNSNPPPAHWIFKKVMFSSDVSTDLFRDSNYDNNYDLRILAAGKSSYPGGYINYGDFTSNDVYSNNIKDETPRYVVDNCVTIFYYTDDSESTTYDTSISLRFPPIMSYVDDPYSVDNYDNIFIFNPKISLCYITSISTKTVTLQNHPYSNQEYSFDYNGYRSKEGIYRWIDYSGNCDLSYTGVNGNNQPVAYDYLNSTADSSAYAPLIEIGFQKKDLSFHTRDNIKSKLNSNSDPPYPGWIELKISLVAAGEVPNPNLSHSNTYSACYIVDNLKVRIIKVKLLSSQQKFFIGNNYPSDIKISNSSGTLVQVKEIWLGNVKVWPCSYAYDFDNPDSSTNANVQINLKFTRFDFYSTLDEFTKYGSGIPKGSVFVSLGYIIEDYNDNSHIYNVHQAAYDNRTNSGIFSGCNAAKYYTQIKINGNTNADNLQLTCNSPKSYYITFDSGGEYNVRHVNCAQDSNCRKFFKNINQFTPIKFSIYLCCPKPDFSSGDGYYINDNAPKGTDITGTTNQFSSKIRIGDYEYNSKDIYRFASKELMYSDSDNIIFKGANCENVSNDHIKKYDSIAKLNSGMGYLNTINQKTAWHLGSIAESNIDINFVVNIYAAPNAFIEPIEPPPTPPTHKIWPLFKQGSFIYRKEVNPNTNNSNNNISITDVNMNIKTKYNNIPITNLKNPDTNYYEIYNGYINNKQFKILLYLTSGTTRLNLSIEKTCTSYVCRPIEGCTITIGSGTGPNTSGYASYDMLKFFDYNLYTKYAISTAHGSISKISNNYPSDGDVVIYITVKEYYSTITNTVHFVNDYGVIYGSYSGPSFEVSYVYISSDSATVSIRQKPITGLFGSERAVVNAYVDAYGGFNYGQMW